MMHDNVWQAQGRVTYGIYCTTRKAICIEGCLCVCSCVKDVCMCIEERIDIVRESSVCIEGAHQGCARGIWHMHVCGLSRACS
jgi:hypothetical protein